MLAILLCTALSVSNGNDCAAKLNTCLAEGTAVGSCFRAVAGPHAGALGCKCMTSHEAQNCFGSCSDAIKDMACAGVDEAALKAADQATLAAVHAATQAAAAAAAASAQQPQPQPQPQQHAAESADPFHGAPCYRTKIGCGDWFGTGDDRSQSVTSVSRPLDATLGYGPSTTSTPPSQLPAADSIAWSHAPRLNPQLVRDLEHLGIYSEKLYEEIVKHGGTLNAAAAENDAITAELAARHHDVAASVAAFKPGVFAAPIGKEAEVDWYGGIHVRSNIDPNTGLRASSAFGADKFHTPELRISKSRLTFGGTSYHSMVHAPHAPPGKWPQVDREQFPLFYEATGREFVLKPGDTLYIPNKYWHWVHSTPDEEGGETIAVNVWTKYAHEFERGCNSGGSSSSSGGGLSGGLGSSSEGNSDCAAGPTLHKHAAKAWPALKKWSLAYLQQAAHDSGAVDHGGALGARGEALARHPSEVLAVGSCAKSDHIYPEMLRKAMRVVGAPDTQARSLDAMAEVVKMAQSGKRTGFACHGVAPLEFFNATFHQTSDIRMPPFSYPPSITAGKADANVWVTVGKVHSGLHYDDQANSLTVLSGTKRVFLFAQTENKYLYPAVTGHPRF